MPEAWLSTPDQWGLLAATTAGVAIVHTLLGPDHYLPFIAMFRAGRWTRGRALRITAGCGLAHVLASLLLGGVGVALGASLTEVTRFDSLRGSLAAWGLILFGTLYAAWGLRRALRGPRHSHWHAHADGTVHDHAHAHAAEHVHVHENAGAVRGAGGTAAWTLLTLFLLGPCEPLIPLLMAPAAAGSLAGVAGVAGVFTGATLASMLAVVWLGTAGREWHAAVPGRRFAHALAGGLVCLCGVLMEFGGL